MSKHKHAHERAHTHLFKCKRPQESEWQRTARVSLQQKFANECHEHYFIFVVAIQPFQHPGSFFLTQDPCVSKQFTHVLYDCCVEQTVSFFLYASASSPCRTLFVFKVVSDSSETIEVVIIMKLGTVTTSDISP